jgi:hypothetical protein
MKTEMGERESVRVRSIIKRIRICKTKTAGKIKRKEKR